MKKVRNLLLVLLAAVLCLLLLTGCGEKDVTVSVEMGMPKLLFSLSSAPLLLIPLAIVAAVAAFIAFIQNEKNVGMLFSFVAAVSYLPPTLLVSLTMRLLNLPRRTLLLLL